MLKAVRRCTRNVASGCSRREEHPDSLIEGKNKRFLKRRLKEMSEGCAGRGGRVKERERPCCWSLVDGVIDVSSLQEGGRDVRGS